MWAGLLAGAEQLMDTVLQLLRDPGPGSVLAHGDYHAGNIAIGDTGAAVLDLQCARLSSGVEDIVQYLYQVRAIYSIKYTVNYEMNVFLHAIQNSSLFL